MDDVGQLKRVARPVSEAFRVARLSSDVALLVDHVDVVDYLKVDIEGAERRVIAHPGGWVDRVRVMHVELHDGYADTDCIADLERVGLSAVRDPRHWVAVTATREPIHAATEAARG